MAASSKALRKRHDYLREAVEVYKGKYSVDTPYLTGTLNGLIVALSIMDGTTPDLVGVDEQGRPE